ncbi:hypothetical protein K3495_g5786 [Podosphaera aphanis]|nr:hypothetical protein K3495_g5786 [Podosphaera aphanis]
MKLPSLPSRLKKRGVLDIKKYIPKSTLENTVASFPLVRKQKDSGTSSSSDKSLGENADEKSSTTKSSDGKSKSSSSEKSSSEKSSSEKSSSEKSSSEKSSNEKSTDEKSGTESKPSTAKLTAGDAGGKPSGSSSTDSKSSSDGKHSDTDKKSADSKSSTDGKSSDNKSSSDGKHSDTDKKSADSKSSTDGKSSEKDSSTVEKPSSGKSSTDSKLSTDGKFSDNTSTSGGKSSSDGKSSVSNGNSADSKTTSGGKLADTKSASDGKLGSSGKSNTGTPESDVKTPQLSASSPALFGTTPDLPSQKGNDTLVVTVPATSSLDSSFTSGKQESQPIETQLSPHQPSEEKVGGEASLQTDSPFPILGDVPQPDLSNPALLPEDSSKPEPIDPLINKQPNFNDDGGLDAISLGKDSGENVNGSTVIIAHAQPDGTNVTRALIITFSIVAGLICFALIIYIIRMRLRHRRVGRAESPPPSPRLGFLDAPQLPPTMDLGQPRFGNATPDSFYRFDEERLRQEDMKLNYGIVV